MSSERIYPNVVLREWSPNRYSPRGAEYKLIVIHSTESFNREGVSDLRAIGDLFANPERDAAAQVCTDAEGQSARYVHDTDAAWACVGYNRVSLNCEQIGHASQSNWPEKQVKETARWVALWSNIHGIPIQRGRTAAGVVLRKGIVTHQSLGATGGGHSDPGPHYPMNHLLDLAHHYKKLQRAAR